jgi:hypothetical protein
VQSNGKTYLLKAATQAQADLWVGAIEQVRGGVTSR